MLKFFIYSIYNILFFQEAVTPVMEGIVDFHNYCFIYLINIFILIIWFLTYIVFSGYWVWLYEKFNYYYLSIKFIEEVDESADEKYQIYMFNPSYFEFKKLLDYKNLVNCEEITYYKYLDEFLLVRKITQNVNIELIWTIIPMIIIIFLAIPSFVLLYSIDEVNMAKLTIKVLGYQWYWTYEYAHTYISSSVEWDYFKDLYDYMEIKYHNYIKYDSIMLNENDLPLGGHRLLMVDRALILPVNTHIRVLVTAMDVLHSWAIPSFGVKIDAVPGRINQIGLFIKRIGVFYGQCSELCGVNHGFMPIMIKVIMYEDFKKWFYSSAIIFFGDDKFYAILLKK